MITAFHLKQVSNSIIILFMAIIMDDVIAGYRTLTGKATIVPQWAMGFWQSRERYKTQDEILNTMAEFRKRKIPIDNIVLDWNYWKQDRNGAARNLMKHDFHRPTA